ncbi:hypothetical protein [Polaribacter sp. Asnod1-A03]|uniref:hypothetical protein n=1 Tax=Polaribacter sp. Asnod1-A03 TaxID=3160581 RepID=UPI003866D6CC
MIENLDTFLIPILFFCVVIIIISFSYFFSTKQKIIRTLAKLPIKQVGHLKSNEFARFTGKALQIEEPLIAPYSNRKCILYKVKIEIRKSNGKRTYWRTLINEEKIKPFFLEKNGEIAIVKPVKEPQNYICHLVVDKKVTSGNFNKPSSKFKALLNHYKIENESFLGLNKSLRYSEAIIEVGEQITVAGIAKWNNLKEPIAGYSYSKIAELQSSDNQKLIITDLPNINSKKRL